MMRFIKYLILMLCILPALESPAMLRQATGEARRTMARLPQVYGRLLPPSRRAAVVDPYLHPETSVRGYFPRAPKGGVRTGFHHSHVMGRPHLSPTQFAGSRRALHTSAPVLGAGYSDSAKQAFMALSVLKHKEVTQNNELLELFRGLAVEAVEENRVGSHPYTRHPRDSDYVKVSKFSKLGKEEILRLIGDVIRNGKIIGVVKQSQGDESKYGAKIEYDQIIGTDSEGMPTRYLWVVLKKDRVFIKGHEADAIRIPLWEAFLLTAYPISKEAPFVK